MADIIVVGGCIVDLISYVRRFPRPGETISGNRFEKGFGGKGANQCVMANKLGSTTAMIAKLGDDSLGHEYFENFKQSGINYDFVSMTKESHTSTASITVSEDGQNCIVYVPGAIMNLTPRDIQAAEDLIKRAKVMLCTFECPLDSLITALNLAKTHKVTTIVNAAPTCNSTYEEVYHLADIICLNEVEAYDATNLKIETIEDAAEAIKILFQKGCATVILTLGCKGAVFQNKNENKYIHVPARVVKALDCTGAGDAFMGSLVYYLSAHPQLSMEEAIKRSCEVATTSVLKRGTQSSFPNRNELSEDLFK
ncbi:ribokinase-like [Uloborus diversus]|uniref:ribokinase-like n=1 Tax=Uloborus diversus TaxID=327109 RepID=UPI002409CB76|nr:ribokinase-like [Uloborus diversus]